MFARSAAYLGDSQIRGCAQLHATEGLFMLVRPRASLTKGAIERITSIFLEDCFI
jgi:hypothetical protein